MKRIEDLRIGLYSDGADLAGILEMYAKPWVRGFTTNPTLMHRAGVRNYEAFARSVLRAVPDRPVSLEVFGENEAEMEMQALTIATWGRQRQREDSSDESRRRIHGADDSQAG